MDEPEVIIVFRRIDFHPAGEAFEDKRENGCRIGDLERRRPAYFLDVGLVRLQPRPLLSLRRRSPEDDDQSCHA